MSDNTTLPLSTSDLESGKGSYHRLWWALMIALRCRLLQAERRPLRPSWRVQVLTWTKTLVVNISKWVCAVLRRVERKITDLNNSRNGRELSKREKLPQRKLPHARSRTDARSGFWRCFRRHPQRQSTAATTLEGQTRTDRGPILILEKRPSHDLQADPDRVCGHAHCISTWSCTKSRQVGGMADKKSQQRHLLKRMAWSRHDVVAAIDDALTVTDRNVLHR